MAWPMSQDYNEAIQDPSVSLGDAELKAGQPVTNALGIPMPRSGNFADVYEFNCPSGNRWAIKCFTREVAGLRERYSEISKHLAKAKLPFTVDFQYLEQGVRIRGQWYPVLKMRWVEGLLLNTFVRDNALQQVHLGQLRQIWVRMARSLRKSEMAHADLQHGNVILVPGRKASSLAVKLIDYDGMYVSALADKKSGEVGHPAFQHPRRLQQGIYSAEVDRFPLLAVYSALRAVEVAGRELWERYDTGDNLLFREQDLRQPEASPLFKELWQVQDASLHYLVGCLALATQESLEKTPLLDKMVVEDGAVTPLTPQQEEQATALLGPGAKVRRTAVHVTPAKPAAPKAGATAVTATAPAAVPSQATELFSDLTEHAEEPAPARSHRPKGEGKSRMPLFAAVGGGIVAVVVAVIAFSAFSGNRSSEKKKSEDPPFAQKPPPKKKPAGNEEPDVPPPPPPADVAVAPPMVNVAAGKLGLLLPGKNLTLRGHSARVTGIAFNSDGTRLVSSSGDKTLRLWDAQTGQTIRTFTGFATALRCVAISADGQLLASGSVASNVKAWDARTGQELAVFSHMAPVSTVAFRPDGKCLVSGGEDGRLKTWDPRTGQALLTFTGHAKHVRSAAFSPDGQRLVSGSDDHTLKLWNAQTGEVILTLAGHTDVVSGVAFSADGQRILSGSYDKTLKLWDAQTGREVSTLTGHTNIVRCVDISRDGQRLVSGSSDGTVKVWDALSSQQLLNLVAGQYSTGVAFSPDGRRVASGDNDTNVQVWDLVDAGGQKSAPKTVVVKRVQIKPTKANGAKWDIAGKPEIQVEIVDLARGRVGKTKVATGLAAAFDTPTVDVAEGESILATVYEIDPKDVRQIVGRLKITVDKAFFDKQDMDISFQQVASLQLELRPVAPTAPPQPAVAPPVVAENLPLLLTIEGHEVIAAALSGDGKKIISTGIDPKVKKTSLLVWDVLSGKELLSLAGAGLRAVLSPDGTKIAVPTNAMSVRLCKADNGQEIRSLSHTVSPRAVGFSPDGKHLASGGDDNVIKIWDVETGQELHLLQGHSAAVTHIVFSPDGMRLASASADKTVAIWDAKSGQKLHNLAHPLTIYNIAFSPDSKTVASANPGMVKLWDVANGTEGMTLPDRSVVYGLAFSPDGKHLFSSSDEPAVSGTIKLWDLQTGKETHSFRVSDKPIYTLLVTPDGQRLVSAGSYEKTLKIWKLPPHLSKPIQTPAPAPAGSAAPPDALQALFDLFGDPNAQVQALAKKHLIARLKQPKKEDLADLRVGLKSQQLAVCYLCVKAVKELGKDGQEAWPELVELLKHSEPDMRLEALLTLRAVEAKEAASGLADFLKGTPEEAVGATAVVTLWTIDPGNPAHAALGIPYFMKALEPPSKEEALKDSFLKEALKAVPARALLGIGEASIQPLVQVGLKKRWLPRSGFLPPATVCAPRYLIYALLGDLAGKAKDDEALRKSLLSQEADLRSAWDNFEKTYEARAQSSPVLSREEKQLYVRTAQAAQQVLDAILVMKKKAAPEKKGPMLPMGDDLVLKGHIGAVQAVAFSPDGTQVVSGGSDKSLKVWDARTGKEIMALRGHTGGVLCGAFSRDGTRLVSGSHDKSLKVWNAQTGKETLTLQGHTDSIHSVAFSPDGERLVSGSFDKTLKVWDARTGKEVRTLQGHTEYVYSVMFSPNGERIVSGSVDKTLKIWDTSMGQAILTLKGHTGNIYSVTFSPDSQRIASASEDMTLKIWDMNTGQETRTLRGHAGLVTSVAFSPDGTRLVSGSSDKSLKLWDVQTGKEILALQGHAGPVHSVAFSPDGTRLCSGSPDGTVRVWNLGPAPAK